MSRPLRMFDQVVVYLVTVRCFQGRLLLRPSNETYQVLGGVLARAARLTGVELFAFNFLSNHVHLVVRAPRGNLPQFMQHLLTNVSKKVGAMINWRGSFWERRYAAQPVLDDAALLDKVRYVLAQGVKEGLVRRCADWPGLSSLPLMVDGKARSFPWLNWTRRCRSAAPTRRRDRLDERWTEPEELRLANLPIHGFDRQSVIREFVDDSVAAIEKRAASTFRAVLGLRRLLRQHPHRRAPRPERSVAPWCHTTWLSLRTEYMERYRAFADAFLAASAAWRLGNLQAHFPRAAVRPFLWPFGSPTRVVA